MANECDIDPRSLRSHGNVVAATSRTGGDRPVPLWQTTATLPWSNPSSSTLPPGYTWSFRWSSAIFDLRPQLESAVGNLKEGAPIWSTSARLYVLLTGPNALTFSAQNLTVTATDYAQIINASSMGGSNSSPGSTPAPNLVPILTQDVSNVFYPTSATPGDGNVLGGFEPPGTVLGGGEGYPVRYWRVSFFFTYFVAEEEPLPAVPTPPTQIIVTAGMY